MGIEHQLKKVKSLGLSALALSACLTFLKPVLNLQNSRPIADINALPSLKPHIHVYVGYCGW